MTVFIKHYPFLLAFFLSLAYPLLIFWQGKEYLNSQLRVVS